MQPLGSLLPASKNGAAEAAGADDLKSLRTAMRPFRQVGGMDTCQLAHRSEN
jgi:hypothetical protein